MNKIMKIFDISKYQGKVDFKKMAEVADGVIIRVYSSNDRGLYVDPCFEENYAGAKAAGLAVGCYGFTYANTVEKAEREVRFILDAIKGKRFDLPVAFDMEYVQSILALNNNQRTAICKHWLDRMEAAGYYVALYASTDFIRSKLNWKDLRKYDVWAAQYGPRCTCPLPFGIWQQYGSPQIRDGREIWPGGTCPGVNGWCDVDHGYKDYPTIIRGAGLNGYTKGETGQAPGDGSGADPIPPVEDESPQQKPEPVVMKRIARSGAMSPGDVLQVEALFEKIGVPCEWAVCQ